MPKLHVDFLGNDPEKKDKVIICFGSYKNADRSYEQGISYLKKSLEHFNFDGHFIYRIGGWPGLKNGRLKYANVPYSFKPFFFEEMRDLGYKKILWLDSASIPLTSTDGLFEHMEKHGCCFFGNSIMGKDKIEYLEHVMESLDIPKGLNHWDIVTQVVGLDVDHPIANDLLNQWIKGATKKVAFLEPCGDQSSFALLVTKLGLTSGKFSQRSYGMSRNFKVPRKKPATYIYHNYNWLNENYKIPKDLFK